MAHLRVDNHFKTVSEYDLTMIHMFSASLNSTYSQNIAQHLCVWPSLAQTPHLVTLPSVSSLSSPVRPLPPLLSFSCSLVLFNNSHGECRNVCGLTWHTYQDELANPPLFPLLQNHRVFCHQTFPVPPPNTVMCTETVPIQVLDYCSFPTAHTRLWL